jgi:5'-3' exonuclease
MTGKYTLVFDGNFWLHKTYFIGQKIKTGKPFNFIDEPDADKNLLLWKLATDFASEIKRFEGVVNRVVYTVDSSSWRKKFLDTQYKANRVKSDSINWNAIYECHNEFIEALEKSGVIISRVKGAEADDLIFAWTSILNQNGQNAIIISGDNDLLQLVNKDNSSGANTLYYNKFDKDIHVFPKFQDWLAVEDSNTTHDIFNLPLDLMSNVKQSLRDIIKNGKMKSHEVNVNEFLFRKILIGDSGDNVPPLHTVVKETKAGPRTYGVTDRHVNEINSKFKEDKVYINQSHFFTHEHIHNICSIAKDVIKIDKPVEEIYERWITNRDLVYLHNNCIPKEVTELMIETVETNQKKILSGIQVSNLMNKDSILGFSSYTKEKKTEFNESGIFKSLGVNQEKPIDTKIVEDNSGFDSSFWENLIK